MSLEKTCDWLPGIRMSNSLKTYLNFLLASFYPWMTAVFFGATLLDIKYSAALRQPADLEGMAMAFHESADFLLCIWGILVVSAAAAILLAWNSRPARYLFMASFAVGLFEVILPVLFQVSGLDNQFLDQGWPIRVLVNGLASLLAMLGLAEYSRHQLRRN